MELGVSGHGNRITIRIPGITRHPNLLFFSCFFDHYFRSSWRLIPHRLANERSSSWLSAGRVMLSSGNQTSETHRRGIINLKRSAKKFKIAQRFLGIGRETRGPEGWEIPLCDGSSIPSPPYSWALGWQASNRRRSKERFDCRENPSASSPYNIVHCVQTPSRPWRRRWFAIPGYGAYCQD